jgi:hypothetical protein
MTLLYHSSTNLIAKSFSYTFYIQPLTLKGYYELLQGFIMRASDGLRGLEAVLIVA